MSETYGGYSNPLSCHRCFTYYDDEDNCNCLTEFLESVKTAEEDERRLINEEFDNILMYYVTRRLTKFNINTYNLQLISDETESMKIMYKSCQHIDQMYTRNMTTVVYDLKLKNKEISEGMFHELCVSLFENGVQYRYICCLCYVVGELSAFYTVNEFHEDSMQKLLKWTRSYFYETCTKFMLQNDGWNDFVKYYEDLLQ